MNFFVQAGVLSRRLRDPVVILGILAFSMLNVILSSSLERVRRWNYRVFFVFHLVIGVCILPILFFHTKALRIYMIESSALFIFDIVCRKLDTVIGFATITQIPNTKLIKLKILVPASKIRRCQAAPGQLVYLQIPAESRPHKSSSIHKVLYNPFSVAEISATELTLVLRALNGPTTKAIHHLSHLSKARPPISIEGPYGSSRKFPKLAANFDRILLVAGGVGATFVLPIYRHIQKQFEIEDIKSPDRVTFIWSMRSAAEASWALDPEKEDVIQQDENLKVFITGSIADGREYDEELLPVDGSVELDDLQRNSEPLIATGGKERPDLKKVVDEVFRLGNEEKVAILVCGPAEMARELKRHVGWWVKKGRDVWFHDESFGW